MEQPVEKRLWEEVAWKTIEYSKNKIKQSGAAIAKNDFSKISENDSRIIINNWRAAHAYPLQVIYVYCSNKSKIYKNAIVVQRLKRLESITAKLQRNPEMNIVRMQDLGGCRMIMKNIYDVYDVCESLKHSRMRHKLVRENDYMQSPKSSGYRGVHLIYSYYSESETKSDYNGLLIEIQIRTKLQHLWATAVEVLGLYTHHNLKASQGDTEMLRYMELVSALFAFEEKMPLSKNVPQSKQEILIELSKLDNIKVLDILNAVRVALSTEDNPAKKNAGYYLLIINYEDRHLRIISYPKRQIIQATKMYEDLETNKKFDVVLVSASSMKNLKKAYPNYFADVSEFVRKVKQIISVN